MSPNNHVKIYFLNTTLFKLKNWQKWTITFIVRLSKYYQCLPHTLFVFQKWFNFRRTKNNWTGGDLLNRQFTELKKCGLGKIQATLQSGFKGMIGTIMKICFIISCWNNSRNHFYNPHLGLYPFPNICKFLITITLLVIPAMVTKWYKLPCFNFFYVLCPFLAMYSHCPNPGK